MKLNVGSEPYCTISGSLLSELGHSIHCYSHNIWCQNPGRSTLNSGKKVTLTKCQSCGTVVLIIMVQHKASDLYVLVYALSCYLQGNEIKCPICCSNRLF